MEGNGSGSEKDPREVVEMREALRKFKGVAKRTTRLSKDSQTNLRTIAKSMLPDAPQPSKPEIVLPSVPPRPLKVQLA